MEWAGTVMGPSWEGVNRCEGAGVGTAAGVDVVAAAGEDGHLGAAWT